MKLKTKAQLAGQIFIYIMAAVLAIMIIAYGYKAITSFTDKTNQIAMASFKNRLESEIRTTAAKPRTITKLELVMPQKFKKFCIVDLDKRSDAEDTCLCKKELCLNQDDFNPLICDAWKDPLFPEPNNAFFIEPITPLNLPAVEIDYPGYLCLEPSPSKIILKLVGKGDEATISEWIE